jgi:hypothetical protein
MIAVEGQHGQHRSISGNVKYRPPFTVLRQGPLPSGDLDPAIWGADSISSCSVCGGPTITEWGARQAWLSVRVATDVLPLLVNACSEARIEALPQGAERHVLARPRGRPARGLLQPSPKQLKGATSPIPPPNGRQVRVYVATLIWEGSPDRPAPGHSLLSIRRACGPRYGSRGCSPRCGSCRHPRAPPCTGQAAARIENTPPNIHARWHRSCYLSCMISPNQGNLPGFRVQVPPANRTPADAA